MRAYILPNKQIPLLDTSGNKVAKQQESKTLNKQYSAIEAVMDTGIPKISITEEDEFTLNTSSNMSLYANKLHNIKIFAYTTPTNFEILDIPVYECTNKLSIYAKEIKALIELTSATSIKIKVKSLGGYIKLIIVNIQAITFNHNAKKLKGPTITFKKVVGNMNDKAAPLPIYGTNYAKDDTHLLSYADSYSNYYQEFVYSDDLENFYWSEDVGRSNAYISTNATAFNNRFMFIEAETKLIYTHEKTEVLPLVTNIDEELKASTSNPRLSINGPFAKLFVDSTDPITGSSITNFYISRDAKTWELIPETTNPIRTGTVLYYDDNYIYFTVSTSDYLMRSDYSFSNITETSFPKGGKFAENGAYIYLEFKEKRTSGSYQYFDYTVSITKDLSTIDKTYTCTVLTISSSTSYTAESFTISSLHYSENISSYLLYGTFNYKGSSSNSSTTYLIINEYKGTVTKNSNYSKYFDLADRTILVNQREDYAASLIIVSKDSSTSISSTTPSLEQIRNIVWFNNKYYLSASTDGSAKHVLYTSEDLQSFTALSIPTLDNINIVLKHNNKLLLESIYSYSQGRIDDYDNNISLGLYWLSSDHSITKASTHLNNNIYDINKGIPRCSEYSYYTYNNFIYRYGKNTSYGDTVEVSLDNGATWQLTNISVVSIRHICYHDGLFLMSKSNYSTYELLSSTDGINWTSKYSGDAAHQYTKLIPLNKEYVLACDEMYAYYYKKSEDYNTPHKLLNSDDYFYRLDGYILGKRSYYNEYIDLYKIEDIITNAEAGASSMTPITTKGLYYDNASTTSPTYINGNYFLKGNYDSSYYENISTDLINWTSTNVTHNYSYAYCKGILFRYYYSSSLNLPVSYSYDGISWIDLEYEGNTITNIYSVSETVDGIILYNYTTKVYYKFYPDTGEIYVLDTAPDDTIVLEDIYKGIVSATPKRDGYMNAYKTYSNYFIPTNLTPKIIPSNTLTINSVTIKGTNTGILYNNSTTNIQTGSFNCVAYVYNLWVASGSSGTYISHEGTSWSKFTDKQLRGYSNNTLIFLDGYSYTFSPLGGYTEVL